MPAVNTLDCDMIGISILIAVRENITFVHFLKSEYLGPKRPGNFSDTQYISNLSDIELCARNKVFHQSPVSKTSRVIRRQNPNEPVVGKG